MEILLLCLKIYFARILDVSLGTVRVMFTVKGKKLFAATIAFIEVFIWFMVARDALNTDLKSIFIPFSYSFGYASGTFIGGLLADKLIKGNLTVQVILSKASDTIVDEIRSHDFAVSVIDVKGKTADEAKYMLFIEINKRKLSELKSVVKSLDEKAFMVVNETKMVQNGYLK